jgi:hypothetical protein
MSRHLVVEAVRAGWLTLSFMMLLSRVVFQVAGPVRMRAFLDGWQSGSVKRLWGVLGLLYALFIVAAGLSVQGGLTTLDIVLLVVLVLVLLADGLVNVMPAGFETFKQRLQRAWVRRQRTTGREGDRYLFGTVNALLALASLGMATLVLLYRPIEAETVTIAAGLAVVLTTALIVGSGFERVS